MFFSVVWLFGIGSLIAVLSALKAKRILDASDGRLKGYAKVRLTLLLGGVSLAIGIAFVGLLIYKGLAA